MDSQAIRGNENRSWLHLIDIVLCRIMTGMIFLQCTIAAEELEHLAAQDDVGLVLLFATAPVSRHGAAEAIGWLRRHTGPVCA